MRITEGPRCRLLELRLPPALHVAWGGLPASVLAPSKATGLIPAQTWTTWCSGLNQLRFRTGCQDPGKQPEKISPQVLGIILLALDFLYSYLSAPLWFIDFCCLSPFSNPSSSSLPSTHLFLPLHPWPFLSVFMRFLLFPPLSFPFLNLSCFHSLFPFFYLQLTDVLFLSFPSPLPFSF